MHAVAVLGVLSLGWSWTGAVLALALYYVRMFFLTAGYHRFFSHRTFKTTRVVQFLLALGGTLAVQKGVLWWAANHRLHHRYTDGPDDVHSPRVKGLWWSHVGWVLSPLHERTRWDQIADFARYPELRWLNRHFLIPPVGLALCLLLAGGPWALVWGFFVSTVLLWHGTFVVNSLSHRIGSRRYDTNDDSRNSLAVALMTMGEGWHNNHHRYPTFANQGFFWWEVDVTYQLLRLMRRVGLIWDLRRLPREIRDRSPVGAARQVPGAARRWRRAFGW